MTNFIQLFTFAVGVASVVRCEEEAIEVSQPLDDNTGEWESVAYPRRSKHLRVKRNGLLHERIREIR